VIAGAGDGDGADAGDGDGAGAGATTTIHELYSYCIFPMYPPPFSPPDVPTSLLSYSRPMISAGDFDLMEPLFRMYVDQQMPVLKARSKAWWNASGAVFAETSYFWGNYEPVDYGCGRHGEPDRSGDYSPVNVYVKHHYEGMVELAVMLLQAYDHTGNTTLLHHYVLPWCDEVLRFYDTRYPKVNATKGGVVINLAYAQSCETYGNCTNPAVRVASSRLSSFVSSQCYTAAVRR
jgi:hypothetical protein